MKQFLAIPVMAIIFSSCATIVAPKASQTQVSRASQSEINEWSLVEMNGLLEDLESTIPHGWKRIGSSADKKHLTLRTRYDVKSGRIVGMHFSGCNGLYNFSYKTYENQWNRSGAQKGCVAFFSSVDSEVVGETKETFSSVSQLSEDKFLELSSDIADVSVDWNGGVLVYLNNEGEPLMQFKLQEAAQ